MIKNLINKICLRLYCLVSPDWKKIGTFPLTDHLYLDGRKIGENLIKCELEENRCGDRRLWAVEDGKRTYKISKRRLLECNEVDKINRIKLN